MRKFSFIILLLTLLPACGQRGPLYLPKDAAPPPSNAQEQSEILETDKVMQPTNQQAMEQEQ